MEVRIPFLVHELQAMVVQLHVALVVVGVRVVLLADAHGRRGVPLVLEANPETAHALSDELQHAADMPARSVRRDGPASCPAPSICHHDAVARDGGDVAGGGLPSAGYIVRYGPSVVQRRLFRICRHTPPLVLVGARQVHVAVLGHHGRAVPVEGRYCRDGHDLVELGLGLVLVGKGCGQGRYRPAVLLNLDYDVGHASSLVPVVERAPHVPAVAEGRYGHCLRLARSERHGAVVRAQPVEPAEL